MQDIEAYLSGAALYGDDFDSDQLAAWFADEKEGYADLGAKNAAAYKYVYHAWNRLHAYSHLPAGRFAEVLGFGSAYGDELLPLRDRIGHVTIVDPSDAFTTTSVHGIPATYVRPAMDATLPLPDDTFDLTTCFGVLHHIPNVSAAIRELARTLKPGGYLALREPIVSMGDWRKPRPGLTRHERGIPLDILRATLAENGLVVEHSALCGFALTTRMFGRIKRDVYNSPTIARIDAVLAAATRWNLRYHATTGLQKIRPTAAFFVARKAQDGR